MHILQHSLGLTWTAQPRQSTRISRYDLCDWVLIVFSRRACRKRGSGTYPSKAYPVTRKNGSNASRSARYQHAFTYPTAHSKPCGYAFNTAPKRILDPIFCHDSPHGACVALKFTWRHVAPMSVAIQRSTQRQRVGDQLGFRAAANTHGQT